MKITPEKREAALWGSEAEAAEGIVNWYNLLFKFQAVAEQAHILREAGMVDESNAACIELAEQIRRCEAEQLDVAHRYLLKFLTERFLGEKASIASHRAAVDGIRKRWREQGNAAKFGHSIAAAKTRKAVGGTREECIDAALQKLPTAQRVKPGMRKKLTRILTENKVLPAARKKTKNG